jgi:dipeptidyl aminopeptidase/acylaminoacyl peptidase
LSIFAYLFAIQIQRETNNDLGVDISPEKPIYMDANEYARALLSPMVESTNFTSSSDNNRFLIKIYPVLDGRHGLFKQIALIPFTNKKPIGVTIGRNEVTKILGWDNKNQAIYFINAPEDRPGQRHLYKVDLEFQLLDSTSSDINIRPKTPICLTCDNSINTYDMNNTYNLNSFIRESTFNHNHNEKDIFVHMNHMIGKNKEPSESDLIPNNCLYNRVHMSTDFSYYVLECLGPETPSIYLVDSTLAKKIYIIDSGAKLTENVLELALPQVKTFSVEIRDGFHAQVRLYLPPMAKEDEEVSFPLILHIDSTPGSQLVSEEFKVDWNHYLASQKSFIVAQIDGRGSGYQGVTFESQIKGNVSVVDVEDQLTVLT